MRLLLLQQLLLWCRLPGEQWQRNALAGRALSVCICSRVSGWQSDAYRLKVCQRRRRTAGKVLTCECALLRASDTDWSTS